ncbi:MAG: thymidine kinase [Candidatus Roizmanbacteria bacterium]|nr:thymidine kinase [Candidatus Roizmanbacteria bacterium]
MNTSLTVITGPMFSGKSEELVRHLRRYAIANIPAKVFNHALDIRYGKKKIISHSKESWDSIPIKTGAQILSQITADTKVVVIDEVQFFNEDVIMVISHMLYRNINVIAAGLDTDFRGEPFGPIGSLLCMAEKIIKLKAVCSVCHEWNATRTQRLLNNGEPAPYTDPLIKVGALDSYQARCHSHHDLPEAPFNTILQKK